MVKKRYMLLVCGSLLLSSQVLANDLVVEGTNKFLTKINKIENRQSHLYESELMTLTDRLYAYEELLKEKAAINKTLTKSGYSYKELSKQLDEKNILLDEKTKQIADLRKVLEDRRVAKAKEEFEKTSTTTSTSTSTSGQPVTRPTATSKVVVPTHLSDQARQWAKQFDFTYIGDSLGVGSQPFLSQLFPKANFDVLTSRFLNHPGNPSLNGMATVNHLKSTGQLKSTVVVALGTNGGASVNDINQFVQAMPNAQTIVFVTTASSVAHRDTVNANLRAVAASNPRVYVLDWGAAAIPVWGSVAAGDGIHMAEYQTYANNQAQGLYQLFGR